MIGERQEAFPVINILRLDSKADPQGKTAFPRQGALVLSGERTSVRLDYNLRSEGVGAYLRFDDNDAAASFLVRLPGVVGSVRVQNKALRHLRDVAVGASLDWSEGGFWLHWQPEVKKRNCFDLAELALGKLCQEQTTRVTVATQLMLPEGSHPCVVTLLDVATWRELVPKATRREFTAAEVRFAVAPRYPGKGEDAHNLEDDFVSASYLPGIGSVGDALAHVYGSVMRTREARASYGWKPKEGAGAVMAQPIVHSFGTQYDPAIEAVRRLFQAKGLAAYRTNGVGLLVVHVDKKPVEGALVRAQTRLDELCTGIDETAVQHVAVVTGSGRVYGFDEHANLVPFNLDHWPGSSSVFFLPA